MQATCPTQIIPYDLTITTIFGDALHYVSDTTALLGQYILINILISNLALVTTAVR